ncbi:hypothetical protein N7493_009428 [Penicillium malachiteum]|uniref:Uncharacterized protein n=1 Tax=Penicillium malachiteum TaxID=1324776 RepID=A0AAD6MSE2_9EURO|nr:hypothetical protein N7493_009428 [Penicillium malachiteum]
MAQKRAPVRPEDISPACPIPYVVQPAERIEWLKERLKDPKNERQTTNLLALIKMYETGELGPLSHGHTIFVCEGKIVDSPTSENFRFGESGKSAVWAELAPSQLARSGSFGFLGGSMHEMYANLRLITFYGGIPGLFISGRIANDTGSSIQTIFFSDLTRLQYNPQTYLGNIGQVPVNTASGVVVRERIMIEIQILDYHWNPITPWFIEYAVITPDTQGSVRLSGTGIRNHLYFATAPGNMVLYVANTKNGLVSQLPVV